MGAVPRPFLPFAAAVVLGATAVAVAAGTASGPTPGADASLWLLAGFVVLGELMPIHVPRRAGNDWLTVSSAFGLAALLAYGLWPALAVYTAASLAGDVVFRTRPAVAAFNAAQYVLALAAAAAVLELLGAGAPVASIVAAGPAVLAGAAAFFVVNELLAGTGSALLSREPIVPYLLRDLPFQLWTGGFQLALAPIIVAVADAGAWLVPLAFAPLVAVWLGGRQAALNAYHAVRDRRTDLPNRDALRDELARAPARALVLDLALEDLPEIRRTLGHEVADDLLVAVAGRLRGALGDGEVLGRLCLDDLGVVRHDAGLEHAGRTIERLLAALDEPFEVDGLALDVRAVAGVAAGAPGQSEALLDRAALAVAVAREGAGRWAAHEADHELYTRNRLALATQLRRALRRGELVVDYQLKVPLAEGCACGVEALVRWEHPQLGRLAPDGFIGLAERSGLIARLTDTVLATALRDLRGWLDGGLDVQVAVNLSTALLGDPALPERITQALIAARVPAEHLQLEITESRLLADDHGVIAELRARGVSLAIDDFGVGFSSLAQVRRLPVSELKIDKSFVLGMIGDPGDAAVVRAAIGLGRDLDLAVVAEGVEDAATARRLGELGCHYAQGYHYGPPAPAAECERRLRALAARPAGVVAIGAAS